MLNLNHSLQLRYSYLGYLAVQLTVASSKIEYHKVAGSKCRNGSCNSEIAASFHGWPREVCGLQILWPLSGGASPSPSTKQVQCAPKNFLLLQHKLDKVAHTHRHFSRHVAQLQASPFPSTPSSATVSCLLPPGCFFNFTIVPPSAPTD